MAHGIQSGGNDLDAYRQRARTWLEASPPHSRVEHAAEFAEPPLAAVRGWKIRPCEAGLAGITCPTEYRDRGLTLSEHMIANEQIGCRTGPESPNFTAKEMTGQIIPGIGADARQQRFLRNIPAMREIRRHDFSEPEAGSDLAGSAPPDAVTARAARADPVMG